MHDRKHGNGRKKRQCEDLLSIYETLDKAECELPRFVAEDLNKVPSIKASDAYMCVLVSKITDLTEVVDQLRMQVSDLRKHVSDSTISQPVTADTDKVLDKKGNSADMAVVIPKNNVLTNNRGNAMQNADNVKRYHSNKKILADVVK